MPPSPSRLESVHQRRQMYQIQCRYCIFRILERHHGYRHRDSSTTDGVASTNGTGQEDSNLSHFPSGRFVSCPIPSQTVPSLVQSAQ